MENYSWDVFAQTGKVEAYLLYKKAYTAENDEEKTEVCQKTEQEELL